ncbi:hypothetical protein [Glaciihabitans sp. UYNi722]|uniref:hypothetical protein n=1 Tax=Glaciihabitans sp. UYNi722 TaxID=3156344 RepID=UPI003392A5E2
MARTLVDIAASDSFMRAIGMIDNALRAPRAGEFRHSMGIRPLTREDLADALRGRPNARGLTKAKRAFDFGDGLSDSLGESISRVQFLMLGIPAPELQVPFYDEYGLIGYADFYWRYLDLIGEFDGWIKYKDRRYLRGQLPEEVFRAEKIREDRMRRFSSGFVRWDWATAFNRQLLLQRVAPFGLVPARTR